uniref:Uncharacterized protein n=1 Tax=Magallana gigas TaxID=29159 RepID=A0A8W8I345_MAGGI
MLRDATTKKGRHFYGVKFSTDSDIFTAGLREVSDGKADTYVSTTTDILNEISDGHSSEILNNDKSEGEQSFNPQKLVSKLFYHVWTNVEGENIEWNGQIIEYKNGIFKVQYWQDDCERDEDLYELTEQEFKSDLREGNLFIINNTDLDHCYGIP